MSAAAIPKRLQHPTEREKEAGEALQASRRADAEQLAQNPSQLARGGLDQVPFADFDQATQPTPPRSTRLADMGEASFGQLTPQPLQSLTPGAPHASTIRVHGRAEPGWFVRPTIAITRLLFGDVGTPLQIAAQRQRAGLVIALVRHDLFDLRRAAGLLHID